MPVDPGSTIEIAIKKSLVSKLEIITKKDIHTVISGIMEETFKNNGIPLEYAKEFYYGEHFPLPDSLVLKMFGKKFLDKEKKFYSKYLIVERSTLYYDVDCGETDIVKDELFMYFYDRYRTVYELNTNVQLLGDDVLLVSITVTS